MKTCGELWHEAAKTYLHDRELLAVFADGFVTGQAEKVYLGACQAAMFRPSKTRRWWFDPILRASKDLYGLLACFYPALGEFWLFRDANAQKAFEEALGCYASGVMSDASWNSIRGNLCGIPSDEIDIEYQKREGYLKACDLMTIEMPR